MKDLIHLFTNFCTPEDFFLIENVNKLLYLMEKKLQMKLKSMKYLFKKQLSRLKIESQK